ncbi:alpha/beta hydrolase [Paraburkholderia hospita]|uniref:alpha/beta hydrolase n=1 Tax=Paraburkholderia hospita TaxID=169430 RepID=UPI0009A7309E|nr:alpha/beta hydrolase [Paraburkholderia hospita]AXF00143.1 alpha/beta hydrolase [Paraburkholderia hospita]SKC77555.1 Lysophospholipase, alpha-beta hydrolase superfamily [Paraburkholderia hospita]SOE54907.1 Lysophospholipase, alpha-beta hydrolase superfamily [Burkholderia sp. YR290]
METSQAAAFAARNPERTRTLTRDGLELPLYRWRAAGLRCATVALVHGLAEHAGRYAPLAQALNANGIELIAIDLRGHGDAPGRRAWTERFDEYLLDADALITEANRNDGPLFLMGHSMGGAIAALYAIEKQAAQRRHLNGLILSSPALAPGRDVPRWMLALSQKISLAWPTFPAMKIDAALLSRDPSVVDANRNDPLVHHGAIPARTGAELLLAMQRIEQGRAGLRTPLLIWHGTADKLTEPNGSRDFGAHAGSPDKTLTLYEGSYHETMNDLDRERVIDALVAWILKRSE